MVTQSQLKNFIEHNYGSIYKTSGGGRNQLGGQKVKTWLKKILGNRMFDLYVKYMGIKTLTTATLVPFGLILSRDYLEAFLKEDKQVGGGFLDRDLPFIDNELIGTYLKIVGLSIMDLTPQTLLPLGAAMVLYDLALRDMLGGFSQSGGARNITGSDIPPGFIQKIDYAIRGQSMPEPIIHLVRKMGENNNNLQRECSTGNCGKNVYTSADPVVTPKLMVKGFPSLGVDSSYSENTWSGQLLDYTLPRIPAAMAGGARSKKRRNQKGKGSDWMASQYSRGPVNSPTMNNNQFRAMNKSSQLVDNSNFTGKNMANNAKLIIDTPLYAQNHPEQGVASSQFAGNLEPNELFAEQRVEYGVATSQFGGEMARQLVNDLERNNKDRRKLVTCLTNQCKKKNLMSNEQSVELRRQSKDNRYNTQKILEQFPVNILQKELQKRHKH